MTLSVNLTETFSVSSTSQLYVYKKLTKDKQNERHKGVDFDLTL